MPTHNSLWRLAAWWRAGADRRRADRTMIERLDDHMLTDIGYTRASLRHALRIDRSSTLRHAVLSGRSVM